MNGGLFRLVTEILTEQEEDRDIASLGSKRDIKAWIKKRATEEWLLKARACSRLASTYQDVGTLETRGYLSFDFKGRQVLTKLRVDDLILGAASFNRKIDPLPMCQMCGVEPETREHFLLKCRSLVEVRATHAEVVDLTRGLSKFDAWRTLILARPRGATENLERAREVGAYVHDLWTRRAKLLGTNNIFLR